MTRLPTTQILSRRQALAATVGFGVLVAAGCRAPAVTANRAPPTTLTMLAPPHPVTAVQDLIAKQAAAAAREVGVGLTFQALPPDDLRSKLAGAVAAGQLPDLALVSSADPAPLAARGLLRDVREALDRIAGLNGELFPPLRALAANGPFADHPANEPAPAWSIPYLSLGGAWLIRQDVFLQKSLPAPKSFDDVRATATKLANQAGGTFGWGAALPADEAVDDLARVVLLAHGAPTFDALGLRIAVDPATAALGLQAIANLYRGDDGSPTAPAGAVAWTTGQVAAAFVGGGVAQTIDFGGLYAQIVTKQPGLRHSILALPPPSGPKGWFTSLPATFLIVPGKGKAPDRAVTLIERLLRPERYDQLARAGLGSVIPPYAYLTKGPFWDEDPNYPAFVANARGDPARDFQFAPLGYPAPPTLPAAVVQASGVLANALRSVVTGETSATAAAAALKQQAEALVQNALALQPGPTPTSAPFWLQP